MTEEIQSAEPRRSKLYDILHKKRYVPRWIKRTSLYIVCTVFGLFVLSIPVLYLFAPQFALLNIKHNIQRFQKVPGLESAYFSEPIPVTDLRQSAARDAYTQYGVSFNMPCTESTKSPKMHTAGFFQCDSGLNVILDDPKYAVSLKKIFVDQHDKRIVELQKLLGADLTNSDYALMKAALYANPNDVSFLMKRHQAEKLLQLCEMKVFYTTMGRTIHPVENAEYSGFEIEGDRNIKLQLFDAQDRQIIFELRQIQGQPSQADANEIIQSLHKGDN